MQVACRDRGLEIAPKRAGVERQAEAAFRNGTNTGA